MYFPQEKKKIKIEAYHQFAIEKAEHTNAQLSAWLAMGANIFSYR